MRAHILFRNARNNDRTSCWCERGPDFTCVPSSGGHGWGDTGPPAVFPSLHHGPFLAPKNKGLAQCLQRPDVLLSVGLFPTVPPVRFPGDPCWLQLPDLAMQWSRPAGWAQWWSYKMVAPLKPSLSNPLGVNSSLPGSIYAQKKNPLTAKFPWSNSDILWVNFNVLYMEIFVPVSSASACLETSSLNSSSIHGHLLSTS